MANTIKHKRGSGSDPSANDLVAGEIAIRTDTGVLFTKKDDNSIASISGGTTDLGVSTTSSAVTVTSSTGNNATISEASSNAAGVMSTAHHDKLDGIEANATADQSASEILTAIKTVDGSGSGLDADLVDGIQASSFLRSDANDAFTGNLNNNGDNYITFGPNSTWSRYLRIGGNGYQGSSTIVNIAATNGNLHLDAAGGSGGYASYLNYYAGTGGVAFGNGASGVVAWMGPDGDLWKGGGDNTGSKYWHAGNDGASSGLDADLLDGVQGSSFLRSDAADTKTSGHLTFNDNVKAQFGGSGDLQIYHDASNSYIADTGAGNLFIRANAQLVLESNNGENYLAANENGDVHLYYDGGVRLSTKSDGVDITGELQCDTLDVDGAGDFTGDVTFRGGAAAVNVAADSDIRLVNGSWTGDFAAKIQHHGNYLYIQGGSNGIVFRAAGGSDRAIIDSSGHFRPTADDTYDLGTSSVQWRNAYFDGTVNADALDVDGGADITGNVVLHDHLDLGDDNRIRMGAGDDLHIYHNGTHSYIKEEGTGELRLGSNNAVRITKHDSETIALFNADADVELYHDNSKVLETFSGGVNIIGLAQCDELDCDGAADISGNLTLHANLDLQDNDKILVGSGDDLEIYHDGTHSYIKDGGTGELRILGNVCKFNNAANSATLLRATESGSVDLFYNGAQKLATKSDGVDVTGEVQCDSLDVDGGIDIDGGQIYYDADNNNLHFIDNVKARFGTSSDLRIYHDGSNSFIDDSGTGNLYIRSNLTQISKYTGETCAKFTADGSVELFYDNTVKVNTTSSGIDVSGIVDIDSHIRHNGDGNTYFGFNGNDQINFYTNGGHRFQIDSSGHIYFGQFSTSIPGLGNTTVGASYEKLSSGGAFFTSRSDGPGLFVNRNNDGDVIQFYRSGNGKGSISVNNSGSNFNNGSDYRLKENIVDLTGAITRLKQLQPKRFNFIADSEVTQDGFIAHEAATVLPWAVTGTHNQIELWGDYETDELPEGVSVGDPKLDDDGNTIPVMQGMDYGKVTPLLTAALQEAIAKIETLEAQNADLLARVTALEGS